MTDAVEFPEKAYLSLFGWGRVPKLIEHAEYIRKDVSDAAILAERVAILSLPRKTQHDGYGKSHSPVGWANGYNQALADVADAIRARTQGTE